ncbi:LD-carboxypeptidase [Halobacteriales archaeon SW_7_71_33]|nr:MAG: LD-carboxypeptidase [Halobacteriales archaeon SW_7_71_33]
MTDADSPAADRGDGRAWTDTDPDWVVPPAVEPGDHVAVLSPASNLPFEHVYDLGLERLAEFGVEPVEYPTATADAEYLYDHPEQRAREVERLDAAVLRDSPTRFFGFSDNTNLALYLWNLGIVSFYGGSLLTEFGQRGAMFEYTREHLRRALFDADGLVGDLRPAEQFTDEPSRWAEGPEVLAEPRDTEPNPGWRFENGEEPAAGRLWGGCWETIDSWFLRAEYLPSEQRLAGTVLALETSEELPHPGLVAGQLRALGERGTLSLFDAVLVGRAVTRSHEREPPAEERERYRERQREAIASVFREYNPDAPVVFDLEFGHTYPTLPLPVGARVRIEPETERIAVEGV